MKERKENWLNRNRNFGDVVVFGCLVPIFAVWLLGFLVRTFLEW